MKELGAPTVLLGGTIFVAGASNFVLFPFTSKIIAFFGGIMPSLAFAMVIYFAKMLIFGLSKSPYIVFASQVFNGFNFAIFLAAGVQHTRHISADETITSMYGIFNGLNFGAGFMLCCGWCLYSEIWNFSILHRSCNSSGHLGCDNLFVSSISKEKNIGK